MRLAFHSAWNFVEEGLGMRCPQLDWFTFVRFASLGIFLERPWYLLFDANVLSEVPICRSLAFASEWNGMRVSETRSLSNFGSWRRPEPSPTSRHASEGGATSVVAVLLGVQVDHELAEARSSRASWPFRTTKREPDSFGRRLEHPQAQGHSQRSRSGLLGGVWSGAGGAPRRSAARCHSRRALSAPSGAGVFRMPASASRAAPASGLTFGPASSAASCHLEPPPGPRPSAPRRERRSPRPSLAAADLLGDGVCGALLRGLRPRPPRSLRRFVGARSGIVLIYSAERGSSPALLRALVRKSVRVLADGANGRACLSNRRRDCEGTAPSRRGVKSPPPFGRLAQPASAAVRFFSTTWTAKNGQLVEKQGRDRKRRNWLLSPGAVNSAAITEHEHDRVLALVPQERRIDDSPPRQHARTTAQRSRRRRRRSAS